MKVEIPKDVLLSDFIKKLVEPLVEKVIDELYVGEYRIGIDGSCKKEDERKDVGGEYIVMCNKKLKNTSWFRGRKSGHVIFVNCKFERFNKNDFNDVCIEIVK